MERAENESWWFWRLTQCRAYDKEHEGLTEHDGSSHFEQAGFKVLLSN